ncbi:hypothetical protein [uncultured Tenacibaculum sp.]|uniref:hypothetical protein n=1 Tax=uncultured Tenacibaculum sp. TaxID=174713 RepID=UPI00261661B9|nr:hypothetical protein [uncultured Tenacibaculum sp.]
MKQSILDLGKVLTKKEQNKIHGGVTCHHITGDFDIQVTKDFLGHRLYVDGKFSRYLSGNIEAHELCSSAQSLEAAEMN